MEDMKEETLKAIEKFSHSVISEIDRLKNVILNIPACMLVVDTKFNIILYSNTFIQSFHLKSKIPIEGKNLFDLFVDKRENKFINIVSNLQLNQKLTSTFAVATVLDEQNNEIKIPCCFEVSRLYNEDSPPSVFGYMIFCILYSEDQVKLLGEEHQWLVT